MVQSKFDILLFLISQMKIESLSPCPRHSCAGAGAIPGVPVAGVSCALAVSIIRVLISVLRKSRKLPTPMALPLSMRA
jgi:hypothetical protein